MRFAELKAGMAFTAGTYPVSQQEIIDFATRYDPQWFHVDPVRAQASRWGGLIASGWMTCSIAMRLAVAAVLADSESIGSPGIESIKWRNPLRPGDEVTLHVEVLDARLSRSGGVGVLRWQWRLVTQHGLEVLDLTSTSLFQLSAPDGQNQPSALR
jgi:acyl dehydratase